MFNFDLKQAEIFQAIKWAPIFGLIKILKKLFLILFIFCLLAFLYGFLFENFSSEFCSILLGLSIIFLTLFAGFSLKESFFNSKLKNPKIKHLLADALAHPENFNLASFLDYETALAIAKFARLDSTRLFYSLLDDESWKINFIFSRTLLDIREIKNYLKDFLIQENKEAAEDFQKIILKALKIAAEKNHSRIESGDMLSALAEDNAVFKEILIKAELKSEDIKNIVWWAETLEKRADEKKRLGDSLAKNWAAGHTITLDRYSTDWTEIMKKRGFFDTVAHKKELQTVERILSRRQINNVLIVGEPGTGRKGIIYGLTTKAISGQSLTEINYKRIVELDMSVLLSSLKGLEEIEETLSRIFQEVISAGNIILVIDNFHNFIGQESRPGVIDISGLLSPYLQSPQFKIIAVTTFEGLHKNIEQKPTILNLFGKVEVSEASKEKTIMILESLVPLIERKYKIFITYSAIRKIIAYADRYIPNIPFPKKAIDILDGVAVQVATTKEKIVRPEHIARFISEKTQIPIGKMEVREKKILLDLEVLIHKRLINQDEAVKEISSALRRARAEIALRKKPIGNFLFLGPTGVGKTETAKTLAEIYFGGEKKTIRLDMSEFQDIGDIPRLIGSPGQEGLLTTKVREDPFSLILLDELEKAHPNILNLFLQVLDEGFLTDGSGRKVDFKNSIIIATSNAGYKIILDALKQETEWSQVKEKILAFLFEKGIFRPEFINRFDAVVIFKPLSKPNLLAISGLMLGKLKKNLQKTKDIEFIITEPLKEKIVELGYEPRFGARNMKRVIQDKVENVLATALLKGELKRGDKVEIDPQEFKLKH